MATDDVEARIARHFGWTVLDRRYDSGCYLMGDKFPLLVLLPGGMNVLWKTGRESRALELSNHVLEIIDALQQQLAVAERRASYPMVTTILQDSPKEWTCGEGLWNQKDQIDALQAQLDTANGEIGEMTNTPAGAQIASLRERLAVSGRQVEIVTDAHNALARELDRLRTAVATEYVRGREHEQQARKVADYSWKPRCEQLEQQLAEAVRERDEAQVENGRLQAEVDSLREENKWLAEQRKEPPISWSTDQGEWKEPK